MKLFVSIFTFAALSVCYAENRPSPSTAAVCSAFLSTERSAISISSLARENTQKAYLVFKRFRRDHLGLLRNDSWKRDFFYKTVVTNEKSSPSAQRNAALRIKAAEKVLEGGKSEEDLGDHPIDFSSENIKVGFVLRGRTPIHSFLTAVKLRVDKFAKSERDTYLNILSTRKKLFLSGLGFGVLHAVFPGNVFGAMGLIFMVPHGLIAANHYGSRLYKYQTIESSLDDIVSSGDLKRWTHITLSSVLAKDAVESLMTPGIEQLAGEVQTVTMFNAYVARDNSALASLNAIWVDLLLYNEANETTGEVEPVLALIARINTPRPPKPTTVHQSMGLRALKPLSIAAPNR